jgi:hypothetical protein
LHKKEEKQEKKDRRILRKTGIRKALEKGRYVPDV